MRDTPRPSQPRRRLLAPVWLAVSTLAVCAGCRGPVYEQVPERAPALTLEERGWTPNEAESKEAGELLDKRSRELLAEGRGAVEARPEEASKTLQRAYLIARDRSIAEESLALAAEAALKAKELRDAYRLYRDLLRQFPRTERYALALDRIFEIGRASIVDGDKGFFAGWFRDSDAEFGIRALEWFVGFYNRHPSADDALYIVGLQQLDDGDEDAAITTWQQLVNEYPQSEYLQSAQLRIAEALIRITRTPEKDQKPLIEARDKLREYVRRFPTGDDVVGARQTLAKLEEDLAQHEVGVAETYVRRRKEKAYVIYLSHVKAEYGRTEAAKEARQKLTEFAEAHPDGPVNYPDRGLFWYLVALVTSGEEADRRAIRAEQERREQERRKRKPTASELANPAEAPERTLPLEKD